MYFAYSIHFIYPKGESLRTMQLFILCDLRAFAPLR